MSRAFGLLVARTIPVPGRTRRFVLAGPSVGIAPDAGAPMIVQGALGGSVGVVLRGLESPLGGQGGVMVETDDASDLVGGILFEEGVACRVRGARFRGGPPRSSAARFNLRSGARAYGFMTTGQDTAVAVVVGGGLRLDADLWTELDTVILTDGGTFRRDDFGEPIPGWPVEAWAIRSEKHSGTLLATRPCGPAAVGTQVCIATASGAVTGSVINQQARGVVQIRSTRAADRTFVVAQQAAA